MFKKGKKDKEEKKEKEGKKDKKDKKKVKIQDENKAPAPKAGASGGGSGDHIYTKLTIPPDGGWGWVIMVASFVCLFVIDGNLYSYPKYRNDVQNALGINSAMSTMFFTIQLCVYLFLGPFVGAMCNMFGLRPVIIVGGIITVCAYVLTSFVSFDFAVFLITYSFIGGAGMGIACMPVCVAIGFYFDRWRAIVNAVVLCATGLGTAIMSQLVEFLNDEYGFRKTMWFQAGFLALIPTMGFLYRPLKPVQISVTRDQFEKLKELFPDLEEANDLSESQMAASASKRSASSAKSSASRWTQLSRYSTMPVEEIIETVKARKDKKEEAKKKKKFYTQCISFGHYFYHPPKHGKKKEGPIKSLGSALGCSLFKSPTFNLICFSGFFASVGLLVPLQFIEDRLREFMGTDTSNYLLATLSIGNTLGRLSSGFLVSLCKFSSIHTTTASLVICGSSTIISNFFTHIAAHYTYACIVGFAMGVFYSLRPIIIIDTLGLEKLSNAFGLSLMFTGIACIMATGCGFLIDTFGSYVYPFYIGGTCILIAAVLSFPIRIVNKRERRKAAEAKEGAKA